MGSSLIKFGEIVCREYLFSPLCSRKGTIGLWNPKHILRERVLMQESQSPPVLKAVVDRKVYVGQCVEELSLEQDFRCFRTHDTLRYYAICDDFGPMNMSSVIQFIELLEEQIEMFPSCQIVYCVEGGRRPLTNAIFLLGAYLMIKLNFTAREVSECFSWLDVSMVESFRDATYSTPDFLLTLGDCWRGLERGIENGWIQLPTQSPEVWGKINIDEYEHYDDPRNGDLHMVVPEKFLAFKGPRDLAGREYMDDKQGYRHFSPSYYVDIFKANDVSAVVRLNESEYDGQIFEDNGISFHDLEFDDCTAPPPQIVDAFFRIADNAKGMVAVHCKAGLGRTGTLIALCMMRWHGFTARESIGWLRIMRPGSVIGRQQRFLCRFESSVHAGVAQGTRHDEARSAANGAAGEEDASRAATEEDVDEGGGSEALARQVSAGMLRRGSVRILSHLAGPVDGD